MSLNQDLSNLFQNFSRLRELKGESVFKVIAFQKVGRILNELSFDIRQAFDKNELDQIAGIGDGVEDGLAPPLRFGEPEGGRELSQVLYLESAPLDLGGDLFISHRPSPEPK